MEEKLRVKNTNQKGGKMKRFNWLLIGFTILCLSMVLLVGCVPKSEYEALRADYEAASKELAEIKEVYPPRDFASFSELRDWLLKNNVSERPAAMTAEGMYSKALEIQEDALKDGFIISAWIEYYYETEEFVIMCTAVADGYIWGWCPETDEPFNFSDATGLLKLR